jgi:hypothetical protein
MTSEHNVADIAASNYPFELSRCEWLKVVGSIEETSMSEDWRAICVDTWYNLRLSDAYFLESFLYIQEVSKVFLLR